jgi:hypothetical protein
LNASITDLPPNTPSTYKRSEKELGESFGAGNVRAPLFGREIIH